MDQRQESDAMGSIAVPADRYWGAQTERSRRNFPIGEQRFPRAFLRALGVVKCAAARANHALGMLTAEKANAIETAASRTSRSMRCATSASASPCCCC